MTPLEKWAKESSGTLFQISSEATAVSGTKIKMPNANRLIAAHWAWCRRTGAEYERGYYSALMWAGSPQSGYKIDEAQ